jgi:hypothetical protein
MDKQNEDTYRVWIGCYGGTRGTITGKLVSAFIAQEPSKFKAVEIYCGGHPKFMDGKVDRPVSIASIEALISAADAQPDEKVKSGVMETVRLLEIAGRKQADADVLKQCDAVYAVDSFILNNYEALAGEQDSAKYHTILEAAGKTHAVYGADMDDTEASADFVNKVVVPKMQHKSIEGTGNPRDYDYYNLAGRRYRAGDREALAAATEDLVSLACNLASKISEDAKKRA